LQSVVAVPDLKGLTFDLYIIAAPERLDSMLPAVEIWSELFHEKGAVVAVHKGG
jgi:hypothetical protein